MDDFDGQVVALEPREDSVTYRNSSWPSCQLVDVCDGNVRIPNNTLQPIRVHRNDHVCQVRSTHVVKVGETSSPKPKALVHTCNAPFSKEVLVDPNNQLPPRWKQVFRNLHNSYDSVFENVIGRYNDASGKVRSRIIIGTAQPPTRKLRVPNYCKK